MNNEPESTNGKGWIAVGVLALSLVITLAILLPAIQAARDSARQMSSSNNLKQLALGVLTYSDAFKSLPLGADVEGTQDELGRHGWYTRIMPFLEASSLPSQINLNLPWEHPVHRHIFAYNYACTLSPGVNETYSSEGYGLFHYQGNPNLFHRSRAVKLAELSSGTSNTWLGGEVDGQYQPWGYPFNWRPLTLPFNTGKRSFGGWKGGFQLCMADFSIRFISNSIDAGSLKLLADAPPIATPEEIVVPNRLFQASRKNRFHANYFEAEGFERQKGEKNVIVRFEDSRPILADLSDLGGKSGVLSKNGGRSIDLKGIVHDYPDILTLITRSTLNDDNAILISKLTRLQTLWVSTIELGDEGLAVLKTMHNLREIVTTENSFKVDRLKAMLPNCDVSVVK